MKKGFTDFVFKFILAAGVIYLMGYLFEGVYVKDFSVAFVVAIVLALLNKFVKPLLKIFTLPINILTFGLFGLIVGPVVLVILKNVFETMFEAGYLKHIFVYKKEKKVVKETAKQ